MRVGKVLATAGLAAAGAAFAYWCLRKKVCITFLVCKRSAARTASPDHLKPCLSCKADSWTCCLQQKKASSPAKSSTTRPRQAGQGEGEATLERPQAAIPPQVPQVLQPALPTPALSPCREGVLLQVQPGCHPGAARADCNLSAAQAFCGMQGKVLVEWTADQRHWHAAVQLAKAACVVVAHVVESGTLPPRGDWGEEDRLRPVMKHAINKLGTIMSVNVPGGMYADLRDDQVESWHICVTSAVDFTMSRADLQAIHADRLWERAVPLWFPGETLQSLLDAASPDMWSRAFIEKNAFPCSANKSPEIGWQDLFAAWDGVPLRSHACKPSWPQGSS